MTFTYSILILSMCIVFACTICSFVFGVDVRPRKIERCLSCQKMTVDCAVNECLWISLPIYVCESSSKQVSVDMAAKQVSEIVLPNSDCRRDCQWVSLDRPTNICV